VSDILKNPTYTGKNMQNKFEFVKRVSKVTKKQYYCASKNKKPEEQWITIQYPPLITQDRFDQIQARIENQKRKPKKHHNGHENHFMDENVLFCGYCGSRLKKLIRPIANYSYCCYWWDKNAKSLLISKHPKCVLNSVNADSVDNDIFYEVVKTLSRPANYAKDWLRNIDVEGLTKSVEMLKKREVVLKHMMNTTDPELKIIYQSELKENEDEHKLNQNHLRNAEAKLELAQNGFDRMAEFERAMNEGKAQQMRAQLKTTAGAMQYLCELPFKEKKRIMEAVIAPANGGKVLLRYGTKEEDCEGEIVSDMEFDIDMDRNEALITGLNKKELFNKVCIRQTPMEG
jgi:hypothetical protein